MHKSYDEDIDDGHGLPWATHHESEMLFAFESRPVDILNNVPITENWIIPKGPWEWIIKKLPK